MNEKKYLEKENTDGEFVVLWFRIWVGIPFDKKTNLLQLSDIYGYAP